MQEILSLIITMQPRDILDIFLVATLFYLIFLLLRESRSAVALRGMIAILVGSLIVYFCAFVMRLTALLVVFKNFWVIVILVFIVVFQHDFRRSLTQVGQLRIFRRLFSQSGRYLEEIIEAVRMMAKRRIGAIIVFERRNSLKVYAETGTRLDAQISIGLLRTIFTAYTPLHDGAVIVRDERVVAAGCILPLSSDENLSKDLGTRHRAALGLSEESDAAVVVVSEETGIVSLALNGHLRRGLSADELRDALVEELDIEVKEETNG
ncbi:MAG: diadenylate cyclase CdaA [Candidatus Sumerlaeota bacterium]|nr:diadenylate cyclase CdaA [Candidatus Sumerlaeota bacterium]